jgi:hypothetical protein
MEFCFYTKWNILKFDTKQGTLVQVTNFQKGKEKEKVEEKESFLKNQQRIISIYSGSRSKEKWNKAKADENKSDFQSYIMVKILLKV